MFSRNRGNLWRESQNLRGEGYKHTAHILQDHTCTGSGPGRVAERAHCYPYFIQIWGDCLAKRLHRTGKREITMAMVREIEPDILSLMSYVNDRAPTIDMGMDR